MIEEEIIYCPKCKRQHLDSRWWKYKPHKKHNCLYKDCRNIFETKEKLIGVRKLDGKRY